MSHDISFIVTARDEQSPVLQGTVDGLIETSAGYHREVIVVDDGSEDPVALAGPHVTVLRNPAPIGVAQSRRLGGSLAGGGVLVWVDAHMRFAPDWIEKMLAHVDSGALLCASWWDYELTRAICWGAEFTWCGERNYHAGKTPGFGFRHLTRCPGDGAVEVPMVIGACYMVLRRSYHRFGGYSPYFRVWGKSEQDISARAWITGIGVRCVTGARVGHLTRSQFPYPVKWSDIEFNQAAMVRTAFEDPVARAIEALMQPLPPVVEGWLSAVDFSPWRRDVQSHRQIGDGEFMRRFVPDAPKCLAAT